MFFIHKCKITIIYDYDSKGYTYKIKCSRCLYQHTAQFFDYALLVAITHFKSRLPLLNQNLDSSYRWFLR